MDVNALRDLFEPFSQLPDPRAANASHRLGDIMAISLMAMLCNFEGYAEFETFGLIHEDRLREFLELPRGIPSEDTFRRLFERLDPAAFEAYFVRFTQSLHEASKGVVIAVDGKVLRHSFDHAAKQDPILMVNAFCHENRLVLGQLAADAKVNEIPVVQQLVKLLNLQGATVTADAMHCQKETAQTIIDAGGDYILQAKGNQPTLHDDMKLFFDDAIERGFEDTAYAKAVDIDAGHGRIETRTIYVTWDIGWYVDKVKWPGLRSFICVESQREVDGKVSIERRYFISSHDGRDAAGLLAMIRGHWSIENNLHWSLDVTFHEDASRVRKGFGAQNLARLRRLALNLLRPAPSPKPRKKVSLKTKRSLCATSNAYLIQVLTQAAPNPKSKDQSV